MIIRKAYSGAYIAMCNKELGSDMVLALAERKVAVMVRQGHHPYRIINKAGT